MLAIEVEVNGERVVVAGAKDLALLTAAVGAGVGSETKALDVGTDVHLTVTGLTSSASSRMDNLTWINGQKLRLGDSVTFRIVSVAEADPPAHVFRTPTSSELTAAAEQERRGLTARSRPTRRKRRAAKRER